MPRRTKKFLSILLCLCLLFEQSGFAQVVGEIDISKYLPSFTNPFTQDKFRPLHLRYLSYNNLTNNFQLLLDKGSTKDPKPDELKQATKELLNYFFVGVTLPNNVFWVNLRPDSPDNIIDPELSQTDVGKILLQADLQLKKDAAKLTSPQTPTGREFWDRLYKKAREIFGYTPASVPFVCRPWIVPDEIIIRETAGEASGTEQAKRVEVPSAYIYKATLKVMLEQDHLKDSVEYNFQDERLKQLNEYSAQLLRQIVIPQLTKEINSSQSYAPLRQLYYSLIFSQWFKARFYGKGGQYSWLIDKKDLTNLTSQEAWSTQTYFKEYQHSIQQGEYNIEEPTQGVFGQSVRSYISGGLALQITIPQPGQSFKGTDGSSIISILSRGASFLRKIGSYLTYLLRDQKGMVDFWGDNKVGDGQNEIGAGGDSEVSEENIFLSTFEPVVDESGRETVDSMAVRLVREGLYNKDSIPKEKRGLAIQYLKAQGVLKEISEYRERVNSITSDMGIKLGLDRKEIDAIQSVALVLKSFDSELLRESKDILCTIRDLKEIIKQANPEYGIMNIRQEMKKNRRLLPNLKMSAIRELAISIAKDILTEETSCYIGSVNIEGEDRCLIMIKDPLAQLLEGPNFYNGLRKSADELEIYKKKETYEEMREFITKTYNMEQELMKNLVSEIGHLVFEYMIGVRSCSSVHEFYDGLFRLGVFGELRDSLLSRGMFRVLMRLSPRELKKQRAPSLFYMSRNSYWLEEHSLLGSELTELLLEKLKPSFSNERFEGYLLMLGRLIDRSFLSHNIGLGMLYEFLARVDGDVDLLVFLAGRMLRHSNPSEIFGDVASFEREFSRQLEEFYTEPKALLVSDKTKEFESLGLTAEGGIANDALGAQVTNVNLTREERRAWAEEVLGRPITETELDAIIAADSDRMRTERQNIGLGRNMWEARVAHLESVRQKIENNQLPEVINFGDKHGKATDLERILRVARQAARDGKKLVIVGHGDAFDRGDQNFRNFEILQELKQIANQNPNISVHLCFGNHDVWLIQAILLNDRAVLENWRIQGGQNVIEEFQRRGVDIKELALWMLKNLELFHIDERGFLHLHAGIPANENGDPLINGEQLSDWQRRLSVIQSRLKANASIVDDAIFRQNIADLFEEAQQIFWVREREWIANFIEGGQEGQVRIDEFNKAKLFRLLENIIQAQVSSMGVSLTDDQITEAIRQRWIQALIEHGNEFRQAGIEFEILNREPVVNKNKLDNFLAQLGVNGVVFGHIHLRKLLNLDNRIFCVDVDEGDAGHLVFNGDGIRFSGVARSTEDLIATTGEILANIDGQMIRAKGQLGETVQQEESQLRAHTQLAKTQEAVIKDRINTLQGQASFSKDNMRRFRLGLIVNWGNGLFDFSVRESTTVRGALRVWDIKIGGIAIIAVAIRDNEGRLVSGDSLLVKEGDLLKIGRDRSTGTYVFIVGGRTFDVTQYQQDYALIERQTRAEEFEITLSRALVNNPTEVVMTVEEGATSQTRIEPILIVTSREEAIEALKEIVKAMEFGIAPMIPTSGVSSRRVTSTQQQITVQRKVDVSLLRPFLINLYERALRTRDANDAAVFHRTLKLITASINNDPSILTLRGPMTDAQYREVLDQLDRFNGDNLDAIIQTADRELDYNPIRDELYKLKSNQQPPTISSTGIGDEKQANRNILEGLLDVAIRQGLITNWERDRRLRDFDTNPRSTLSEDFDLQVDDENIFLINSQKVVVIDKDYLSTTEEGEQYASAGLRRGVVYITRAKFQEWRQQGILEQKIKHEQDEVAYLRKKALEMFPGLSETTAYELSSNFLKNPNNAKEAKALISEAHNYAEAQGVTSPQGSAIGGTTSSPLEDNKLTRLPLNSEGVNAPGGIDFRSLPIVTQAINNLNTKISPSALGYLKGVNLTQELSQIQNLINSGTIPSAERIKEYIQSSCIQGNNREDIEGLLSCICDILREQEGYCQPTDQLLKDILVVLEATDSNSELEQIFLGKI